MAELKLYLHDDPVNRRGFALYWLVLRIRTTARFAWEPGMVSVLTTRKLWKCATVDGIAADAPMWPDFEEGWKVSRVLDAIALSHRKAAG